MAAIRAPAGVGVGEEARSAKDITRSKVTNATARSQGSTVRVDMEGYRSVTTEVNSQVPHSANAWMA